MASARGIAEALVMSPYQHMTADGYDAVLCEKKHEIEAKAREVRKWLTDM
jgi:hypothetical protein